MSYTNLSECLACGGKNLFKYLDLGYQPLANQFQSTPNNLKKYPLEVLWCSDCTHSQLSISVDPKELFDGYTYKSGVMSSLIQYFKEFAIEILGYSSYANCLKDKNLHEKIKILEIGSNDNTLLKIFKELGCDVFGVDPSASSLCDSKDGISVLDQYWGEITSWINVDSYDYILGLNVFAHNYNPLKFLICCSRVLNPNGSLIVEFPYGFYTFSENQFQQFYHEHISYFTARSFAALAERAQFGVTDVVVSPIHGGSIRFTLKRNNPHCKELKKLINKELEQQMNSLEFYTAFSGRVEKNLNKLHTFLQSLDKKVIGYGASAKSTVLFNYRKIGERLIKFVDYIVDDNTKRHNLYCPGSNLFIKNPNVLQGKNVVILSNSFNFNAEIKTRLKKLNVSGTMITVVPEILIEDI